MALRDTVSTIAAELRLIFRRRLLEYGLVLRRSEAIDHAAVGDMKFFFAEHRFAIGEECHGVITLDSDPVLVDVRSGAASTSETFTARQTNKNAFTIGFIVRRLVVKGSPRLLEDNLGGIIPDNFSRWRIRPITGCRQLFGSGKE